LILIFYISAYPSKEFEMECRHCESANLVKSGIVQCKQRYKCKDCGKTTRENDARVKYPPDKKLRVLKMYLENMGIRSIERLEGVPNPLIIRWIRNSASLISGLLKSPAPPEKLEDVEIMEMDELYSFIKKNEAESTYGQLRIGTKAGLLILKSPKA
jgi:transposase-like protein